MRTKLARAILVGAAAATAAVLLWWAGSLDRFEYATWAWRVNAFAKPGQATGRIKLVLLDQSSLDWGQKENGLSWPWPREVYGPIIDFCRRGGARAVIFDVLYTEPSVYGVEDDRSLGDAIRRAPAFIGSLCLQRDSGAAVAWPSGPQGRAGLEMDNLDRWVTAAGDSRIAMPKAVFPIGEVASNAMLLANVTDEPDEDGIFRRACLFRIFDGKAVPSPGFAAYAVDAASARGRKDEAVPAVVKGGRIENDRLLSEGREIPIDRQGRMLLRFRGPAGTFRSFSAAAVIQSELIAQGGGTPPVSCDEFKDSYVFFGFSAPGLLDLRPTPVSRIYPGVEVHATVLDNLLSGDFLRELPIAAVPAAALLFSLLGSIPIVLYSRKAWHSAAAFAIFAPMPAAAGFFAYPFGWWWPVAVHEIAMLLSLAGSIILNYGMEGRQKAFIKKAFKHYLSHAVVERILQDPTRLKLGGERRELTIFFSDIEGFSGISEKLDPEVLTSLLNDYLSDMTDIILEEGGTLDKYEGDAIIAFWNAPLNYPDHAERACRAAVRCQRRLRERSEEFSRRAGRVLRARIGMNTGVVVVGNMGSRTRFDYTMLGDAANLASRLEGANKVFGTFLMVSEATWQKTSGKFAGRELGLLRVVGRTTPVRVFELTGLAGEATDGMKEFERGLAFCYAQKWREALAVFEALPDDPAARVYAGQCRRMVDNPEENWEGVWNLTSK